LINMLMFATSTAPEDIDDSDLSLDGPSYWVAVTAVGDSPEGIEFGLQYVGSKFMKHVDNWVAEFTDNAITGLSILASGPLAMMPLQAAAWTTNEGKSYLVDRIPIRYAPSCHLLAMCRRRETLRARIEPSLFGIADPSVSSPLPSSREELVAIAGMFPMDRITTAFGKDATSYFLRQCGGASHLHLACHATADTTNYRDSAFLLADGWFDLHQILRIGGLNSLVAVASACQTGTIDLDGLADEAYSLAGALIAAGSASAVASCWPVDDYATALLLIKFYECLLSVSKPPAASALQTAQIWLRELDGAAEKAFIQEYPALRNAKRRFDRRNLLTKRIPRMFGRSRRAFASEEYWGSFIVVGA
jgi:CHAT domain-containing protein